MKKILVLLLALSLAACSTITKVEGDHVVNQRLAVKVTDAWNKMKYPNGNTAEPYEMWTQEGTTLDHLRLWAAIKPGQALMAKPGGYVPAGQKEARVPTFAAGMPADQLVKLFEVLYSVDGSVVKVTKVEPSVFAGEKGVRFEFAVARKSDDVQLHGVGWVCVRKDEMFAATFVAPRLAFFPRLLPKAEALVKTAQIKG
ncbi:hypothetical protein [Caenimonas soli]|uniref:hypothetical protein n=1 Tax=Caenimonas soli TaxID=2735555 RepID=UPI001557E88E|nr:hypothetical protein [Caenimonas soli]NPC54389.1 hypothetical protein [Caenimonas soli]